MHGLRSQRWRCVGVPPERHDLPFPEAAKALGAWEETERAIGAATETPENAARRLASEAIAQGFVLEAVHAYRNATGVVLHWRIRAKHPVTGEKWIRPMSVNGVGYTLKEPTYRNGKPLYRQDALSATPDAPVFVTEGEWCADALARLGVLATTSGAADSAGSADWRPLAGRHVTIWPDPDEGGQRYRNAVKAKLLELGSHVEVIDVAALGLKGKADVVDWLAAHPDATAADLMALPRLTALQTGQTDNGPAGGSVVTFPHRGGRFEVSDQGVMFIGHKEGEDQAPQWICSRLVVVAKTRDAKSGEWGRLLEWHDDDGVRHRWAMPMELLQGDGSDVRRELARAGLSLAPNRAARDLLAGYLQACPVNLRARCVDRLGWHGPVFATPTETIGDANESVVFQNIHAVEPALSVSGTVAGWRDSVAALAVGNTRLVFAASVSFAGLVVEVAGEDSGGFHLRGPSSSGKTTGLYVAASVWGRPSMYMRMWRATTNGLEGLAAVHNDGVLILDELSQIDPREAGEAAYLLANGQGKARATRTGSARTPHRWRLLFLSSGEESLAALMARVGRRSTAGQEIRLADVDANAGAGMGAFEVLHGYTSPAALAVALKDATDRAHGAVGEAWLRHVVTDRVELADFIPGGIQEFVTKAVPQGAEGQVERVARRFGLVAVAGELATHYGLTGWPQGEAEIAAKACFTAWLDTFGGLGNREERTVLAQVRGFFEAHGASRFEDVTDNGLRVLNRVGFFRKNANQAREFMVLPEAFKREVCAGLDVTLATRLLIANGWIKPGGDHRATQKVRVPGVEQPTRVYVFTEKLWEGDE